MVKRNTPNLRMVSWFLAIVMVLPMIATVSQAAVVNFLSPLPGQANSGRYVEVAVSFNTQSDLAITRLELWIDGKLQSKKNLTKPETRGVCSFQWDTAGYVNGSHFLLVKMFAGEREIASISGAGSVGASNMDVIPPLVKISNIKPGSQVKGIQTIKMTAVDNSGQYPLVSLLVDQKLKLIKNTPPYVYDLDTTIFDDGKHEIQMYAFDAEGNKSDVVTIEVVFANGKVKGAQIDAPAAVAVAPKVSVNTVVPVDVAVSSDSAARATVSSTTEAMNAPKSTVAATAPGKIIELAPQPVKTQPVAKAATPAPKEPVKVAVAVAPKVEEAVVVAEPVVVKEAVVVPVAPVVAEPVVVAKIDRVEIPNARLSGSVAGITASKAVAKIKVDKPVVMASAAVSAPAVPKYVKPVPVKVVKAAPKPVAVAVTPAVKPTVKVEVGRPTVVASVKAQATPIETKVAAAPVAKEAVKSAPKVAATVTAKPAVAKVTQAQNTVSKKIVPEKPLKMVEAPAPVVKTAKIAAPKPVKMAMAPVVKSDANKPLVQSVKAQYDVKAIDSKHPNNIKLRDLVEAQNGVILWDSETRTVTTYVKNMKIEMKIGHNVVKVNGKKMKVNLVPYIVKGRTVIDVRLYDKACQVAGNKEPVASAPKTK